MREFRFSFNIFGLTSRQAFIEECQEAEGYGYDAVFAADHLGIPAPFPLLVAAAEATQRLRVGTLVLNAPFWNPALLAREVATTDILTDGRLEVGLGSGHMKWEFDGAGIAWQGPSARATTLQQMIGDLERFFSTEFGQLRAGQSGPRPVQRTGFGGHGPPLLVGGTGDPVLRIAGQHAQIVGVAGAFQVRGASPARSGWPRPRRPMSGSLSRATARDRAPTRSNGTCSSRRSWSATTAVPPPSRSSPRRGPQLAGSPR